MPNYEATICRYYSGQKITRPIVIPGRVTVTGKEDHFGRAVDDAHMLIAGMREMDAITGKEDVRYWIASIMELG